MRQIYVNEDFILANNSRNRLQAAGIYVEFRNEFISAGPITGHVWPELWVREVDYERALQILQSAADEPVPADWRCPLCHETNPGNFDLCWQCQAPQPKAAQGVANGQ